MELPTDLIDVIFHIIDSSKDCKSLACVSSQFNSCFERLKRGSTHRFYHGLCLELRELETLQKLLQEDTIYIIQSIFDKTKTLELVYAAEIVKREKKAFFIHFETSCKQLGEVRMFDYKTWIARGKIPAIVLVGNKSYEIDMLEGKIALETGMYYVRRTTGLPKLTIRPIFCRQKEQEKQATELAERLGGRVVPRKGWRDEHRKVVYYTKKGKKCKESKFVTDIILTGMNQSHYSVIAKLSKVWNYESRRRQITVWVFTTSSARFGSMIPRLEMYEEYEEFCGKISNPKKMTVKNVDEYMDAEEILVRMFPLEKSREWLELCGYHEKDIERILSKKERTMASRSYKPIFVDYSQEYVPILPK